MINIAPRLNAAGLFYGYFEYKTMYIYYYFIIVFVK